MSVRRLPPSSRFMWVFSHGAVGAVCSAAAGCSVTLDPTVTPGPVANSDPTVAPDPAINAAPDASASQPDTAMPNDAAAPSDPATLNDAGTDPLPVLALCTIFRSATREYELCSQPLTWFAAEYDCRLRGAELASVETDAENEVVVSAAVAVETNIWLSGTRDDDLVWRWATGAVFWRGDNAGAAEAGAYVKWAPNEPNNGSTVSTDQERCLALTLGESDWNDRVCTVELPYLCERPLAQ